MKRQLNLINISAILWPNIQSHMAIEGKKTIHEKIEFVNRISALDQQQAVNRFNELYREKLERDFPKPQEHRLKRLLRSILC